ncbi:LacI family DNA-binding transcriptional regulator [Brachybacterium sp. DNPG3]
MTRKRATVYDVAERAGVSIATVSFAFRKPEKVRPATIEAVRAAAAELGYVPSASARGLAKGRTGAIGLYAFEYLMDDDEDASSAAAEAGRPTGAVAGYPAGTGLPAAADSRTLTGPPPVVTAARLFPLYADEVQRGIELECRRRGLALMIGTGRRSTADAGGGTGAGHAGSGAEADLGFSPVVDVAGRVDALIAFAQVMPDSGIDHVLSRMPVVEFGGEVATPGLNTVSVDNAGAMTELVEHLLDVHGVRRFAYLGPSGSPEQNARLSAFSAVLRSRGLEVPVPLESSPGLEDLTRASVARLLSGDSSAGAAGATGATGADSLPEAIVCATDQEALVVLEELAAAGVRVPEDVLVTGFDGILAGRLSSPTVTTMRQPMEEIGRAAVQMVAARIEDPSLEVEHRTFPATLLLGASCGCRA